MLKSGLAVRLAHGPSQTLCRKGFILGRYASDSSVSVQPDPLKESSLSWRLLPLAADCGLLAMLLRLMPSASAMIGSALAWADSGRPDCPTCCCLISELANGQSGDQRSRAPMSWTHARLADEESQAVAQLPYANTKLWVRSD